MANGRKRSAARSPSGQRVSKQPKAKQASDYLYQVLTPARHEIRLLEVLPGRPDSRVTARLFHISLDDEPHFDALSYMWGAPWPTYDIKVIYSPERSMRYPIGYNLRRALDDLRLPDRPRVLWVDAICINQADHAEREQHVRLMRRIFSAAQRVCAWIDHRVVPTLDVFVDLQKLGESVEIEDFYDPEYWYPVADIFRNPYWRRLWIQQELVLAKKIDIYCCRHLFDGQKLLLFQQNASVVGLSRQPVNDPRARFPSGTFYGGILRARHAISWARRRSQDSSGPGLPPRQQRGSLVHLFTQSLELMMTDPKDRVYGVLGLATDTDPYEVKVDYTMPLLSLSFICIVSRSDRRFLPDYELLSWMPIEVRSGAINAGNTSGRFKSDNAWIDTEKYILYAEGVMVNTISFVGDWEPFDIQPVTSWLEKLEKYCQRLWPSSQDGPLYEREDVTEMLFPRSLYKTKKPTAEQRLDTVRSLVQASSRADHSGFSLEDAVYGGYTPEDLLTLEQRLRCLLLWSVQASVATKVGDQVWITLGCDMPIILRPVKGTSGKFSVMGPVIMQGLMDGQGLRGPPAKTSTGSRQ
ncbi:heterokaryon incompatibility protein-domain-containing protein [Xylaria curta]|nr:heterokaryon incompatibility protein-domain-containing protein [Xylaria curta]